MVTTHGITSAAGYYENTVQQKKDSTVKAKNNTASEQALKSSEDRQSAPTTPATATPTGKKTSIYFGIPCARLY